MFYIVYDWRLHDDFMSPMLFFNGIRFGFRCLLQILQSLYCCIAVLWPIFPTSVEFSISSAQLLPPVMFPTLVQHHPLSLCLHWFLCVPSSPTTTGNGSAKWDGVCRVGNMTYLPTHSHQLSHVSCRVTSSLGDLFHLTHLAFKYSEIMAANLSHVNIRINLTSNMEPYAWISYPTIHPLKNHYTLYLWPLTISRDDPDLR